MTLERDLMFMVLVGLVILGIGLYLNFSSAGFQVFSVGSMLTYLDGTNT